MLSRVVMFIVDFRAIESYFIKVFEIFALLNATTECSDFENLDEINFYCSKIDHKHHHSTQHTYLDPL